MPGSLSAFPEIVRLGRARIQASCDEWCAGSVATQFGVAAIKVSDNIEILIPSLRADAAVCEQGEDYVFFPFDTVLRHIIKSDFGNFETVKSNLLSRLEQLRSRCGPNVFQRYRITAPQVASVVECNICSELLNAESLPESVRMNEGSGQGSLKCPLCGCLSTYSSNDLFRVFDPTVLVVDASTESVEELS